MQRTEMEPVTRTYCDACEKDITRSTVHIIRDENGEQHFCSEHNPRNFRKVVKDHAVDQIKQQPFMVPNAPVQADGALATVAPGTTG